MHKADRAVPAIPAPTFSSPPAPRAHVTSVIPKVAWSSGTKEFMYLKKKVLGYDPITCWGISRILELLDMEPLHSHRLALVPGLVDDCATATLAQDVVLTLCVLQPAVLQEEPTAHTVKGLTSSLRKGMS